MKDSSGNNATTGLQISVGGLGATYNLSYGHSFYYDTDVAIATTVVVALSSSISLALYSNSITPSTYNVLIVADVLNISH
jgi:hypothetical protein